MINVLAGAFRFICIPMLSGEGSFFNLTVYGIDFRRQITDVRF